MENRVIRDSNSSNELGEINSEVYVVQGIKIEEEELGLCSTNLKFEEIEAKDFHVGDVFLLKSESEKCDALSSLPKQKYQRKRKQNFGKFRVEKNCDESALNKFNISTGQNHVYDEDCDTEGILDSSESEEEFSGLEESSDGSEDDTMVDENVWYEEGQVPTAAPPRFTFTADPHKGHVPAEGNALDFFNLYFSDELINKIADETNRNAAQQRSTHLTKNPTDSSEIRVFLALMMMQGIILKDNYQLYWSKKPLLDTPFFRECMTFKRFTLLKRFLHFSNNISAVHDYLAEKFKSLYTLPRDVTIGESLMLYKSRQGWVQYMPLKRACFGIKLFMLCDANNGYVWSTMIYSGKGTFTNEAYKELSISSQIIMTLMRPLLGKGYCLITNNWYTSPPLADLLLRHQTDTYGVVKLTQKKMPPQLKNSNLKKGENISFRRGKIVIMKWKDKGEVTLLSTVHTSGMIVHERVGEVGSIPQIMKDYNNTMGGMHRVDQSLLSYPVVRKRGMKCYRKIFFYLLELAVWNSFILYKNSGLNRKPQEFRMDLIELLVAKYKAPDMKPRDRPGSTNTPLRLSGRHFPSIVPSTLKTRCTTRQCAVCSKQRGDKGKKVKRVSRYQCTECNVGLCVVPCFGDYHTKSDL